MQVRWSPEAAEDLERIGRLIQRDKPMAAKDTVLTLYRGIADLGTFPNRGRSGRIEGTRELIFPSLLAALQKQLGLSLVSQNGPRETLVIDHVERPSEN